MSPPTTTGPTTTRTGSARATGATTGETTGAEGPKAPALTSPRPDRITLAFAGDVHFERAARDLLVDAGPLTAALRDTIGRADFAMVNLETALGEGGAPLPGKAYAFRAPISSLDTLARAGVDAVSMANNHAADFGAGVFAQTLSLIHI